MHVFIAGVSSVTRPPCTPETSHLHKTTVTSVATIGTSGVLTIFSQRSDMVSSFGYQISLETDDVDKKKPTLLIKFHMDLQLYAFPLGIGICMGL